MEMLAKIDKENIRYFIYQIFILNIVGSSKQKLHIAESSVELFLYVTLFIDHVFMATLRANRKSLQSY